MNNYYEDITREIRELVADNKLEKAQQICRAELEMPYVPPEYLVKLEELNKEISIKLSPNAHNINKMNDDVLINMLMDTNQASEHIWVANELRKFNIRNHINKIQDYLLNKKNPNDVKTYLLYVLKEQMLNQEFDVAKNDTLYQINPINIIDFEFDESVKQISNYIDQIIYNDNPNLASACKEILSRYYFEFYPYLIEKNEELDLALAIIKLVSKLYHEEISYLNKIKDEKEQKISFYINKIKDHNIL